MLHFGQGYRLKLAVDSHIGKSGGDRGVFGERQVEYRRISGDIVSTIEYEIAEAIRDKPVFIPFDALHADGYRVLHRRPHR